MSVKYFLDTNIFVYSFDPSEPKKQKRAQALIEKSLSDRFGITSTQVIQEFINVARKQNKFRFSQLEISAYVDSVFKPLCEVFTDLSLIRLAMRLSEANQLSFYDSLIVAAGITAGCEILYTEDLQNGRKIDGLRIENPFNQ